MRKKFPDVQFFPDSNASLLYGFLGLCNCHGRGAKVCRLLCFHSLFNQSDSDVTTSEPSLLSVINPPSIITHLELVREPSRFGMMFGFAARNEFNLLVFPSVEVLLLVFAGVEESNP